MAFTIADLSNAFKSAAAKTGTDEWKSSATAAREATESRAAVNTAETPDSSSAAAFRRAALTAPKPVDSFDAAVVDSMATPGTPSGFRTGAGVKVRTGRGAGDATASPGATPSGSEAAAASATPSSSTSSTDVASAVAAAVKAALGAAGPAARPTEPVVTTKAPVVAFKPQAVNPSQTMEGIISRLVGNTETPWMQRAIALAREEVNGRGLLSSSIAGNAGAQAAIDAAGRIASTDAAIYANQALQNQSLGTQVAVGNADRTFGSDRFNADAYNTRSRDIFSADAQRSNTLLNGALDLAGLGMKTDAQKELIQFSTDQDMRKMAFDLQGDLTKMSVDQKNYLERLTTGLGIDLKKMAAGQQYDLEKLAIANDYDINKMRISLEQSVTLTKLKSQLDTDSGALLARLEGELADNRTGKQSLVSATNNFVTLSSMIRSDPNLTREQKESAIADLQFDWVEDTRRIASVYNIAIPEDYFPK